MNQQHVTRDISLRVNIIMPDPDTLYASVASIFEQAQTSIANHRKNCVALYKIHTGAANQGTSKKRSAHGDQSAFVATFLDMVGRVIIIKKGPPTVERVIKFISHYVRFVNEKAQEDTTKKQADNPAESISTGGTEEDSLASVFVSAILEWIVQGFLAKNKVVRYQAVHLVAEMIMYLGEVDEETYVSLRESLIERATCDKESTIRAQAVSALARLIGSEDPNELQEGERTILEIILDVVVYDPAADVRRAALLHLPLTSTTLPTLLTRTLDVDPLLRKLVYASVFQPRLEHPRLLTISQREQLVQSGLGDREPAVRLAAGKMVFAWFELVLADPARAQDDLPWEGDDGGIMAALIAFLNLFDVVGPGEAVAVDAVLSLLTTRPEFFDVFTFSEDYWTNLTPESAVLARVFLEHCLSGSREDRIEAASLPVVTAFAFNMQEVYNQLLAILEDAEVARALAGDDPETELDDSVEEELAKREVIISELLRMAVKLDYGDEIGRRKVYTVTRAMLAHPQLPPGLIPRCLDVLKEILPSERELIRVVVEIIMDLREPEEGEIEASPIPDFNQADTTQSSIRRERSLRRDKTREEMSPNEAMRADMTDMRCLEVCINMLERVHGDFEDNSTLEGVLTDLVIPAVRRKEVGIREKGLVALGLCCLIAKVPVNICVSFWCLISQGIAVKSLQLFLSQIQNAPEQLKLNLLKIVFDLMVMYDQQLWARVEDGQAILTFLTSTLEAEDSPAVQALLCAGLAKLLLSGLAEDPQTLKGLLLAYVSPYTAGNSELRQCLSYFFSVYCYSSALNQTRLQSIFMSAFDEVTKMNEDLGEEPEHPIVSPQQFGLLVIDWTDARKAAPAVANDEYPQKAHAQLASDILLALYDSDRRSEDQEVLCALLNNLNIEGTLPTPLMVKLSVLVQHIQKQCPFDDPALDKAISRFKNKFVGTYGELLGEIDWSEWETPEMQELYNFIGIDIPDARDARPETPGSPLPTKSRKGKGKAPPKPVKLRGQSKSKAASESEQESEDDNEEEEKSEHSDPSPTAAPLSKLSGSKSPSPPLAEDDEDEEVEQPPSPTPPPKFLKSKGKAPAKRGRSTSGKKEPEPVDEDQEEEQPPSPSPPPKAVKSQAKAPPRRGRSVSTKKEPEPADNEDEDETEDERPPSPSPLPKASKSKGKAPPNGKSVSGKSAEQGTISAGSNRRSTRGGGRTKSKVESEDELVSAPSAKTNGRSKSTARSKSRAKAAPLEEVEQASEQEDEEAAEPPAKKARSRASRSKAPPEPETESAGPSRRPTRASRSKAPPATERIRTPSSKIDLPSPADKKKRKPSAANTTNKGTRASSRRKTAAAPAEEEDSEFGGYGES
ncbi:hypothetical protein MIND_00170500 [Mycena indigotica]|uniref:Nuclear condensin complex subunit 3 C-terminal domain-containing protein n=1 Tax=Mycena indigotica TaxID=2126181 RepID=A0A8H6TDB7_9AGAR|nr:uncharacterized protein MIND_00170500 [Mycena indigotica]KAF7316513.1 hypothetical protein MIND_00170500 [Mycena indigotica]